MMLLRGFEDFNDCFESEKENNEFFKRFLTSEGKHIYNIMKETGAKYLIYAGNEKTKLHIIGTADMYDNAMLFFESIALASSHYTYVLLIPVKNKKNGWKLLSCMMSNNTNHVFA